ncbi:hypothetical protein [Streptomyces spiralis]|uniref:hypothetical protein n=1 Tax=Streptomyces spiralis TaxID=66376 RepID=UPI0036C65A85
MTNADTARYALDVVEEIVTVPRDPVDRWKLLRALRDLRAVVDALVADWDTVETVPAQ